MIKFLKLFWRPVGSICMDCGEHIYYCTCDDKPKRKFNKTLWKN